MKIAVSLSARLKMQIRDALFATHDLFAGFKKNFYFAQPDNTLIKADTELGVIDQCPDFVGRIHRVGACLLTVHAWAQLGPFFLFCDFWVNATPYCRLLGCCWWPILMLSATSVALNLGRSVIFHGDNDVVGVFATFCTASFNRIAGRKF